MFSQIPPQVLNKVNCRSKARGLQPKTSDTQLKKRVKFYGEDEEIKSETVLETSSASTDIDVIDTQTNNPNEPTSSNQEERLSGQQIVKPAVKENAKFVQEGAHSKKNTLDAIIQTEKKILIDTAVQTEESLWTRPLTMTEDDLHRLNMQSFAPVRPIPRARRNGNQPPLKIGLTLRGRKRKVLYPDDDDYVPPDICSAKGA